jgi:lipopolysaccharide/colanic/teichoic acid biosynthesis glycosyltransferase
VKSVFELDTPADNRYVLSEESFRRTISVERKRTERSRKPFLLMLLDMGREFPTQNDQKILKEIASMLVSNTRETDVVGWYRKSAEIGVMFTELSIEDRKAVLSTMLNRISANLAEHLTLQQFNQISISFHMFPEEWDCDTPQRPSNPTLYPDLETRDDARRFARTVKRMMDVAGSVLALLIFSPLFLVIAAAVKLTSKGPIFYRQQRVGQYGQPFEFLKFRSMVAGNDASSHREYVRKLIAGTAERKPSEGDAQGVFKLTNDPRITPLGAFLRRSSLDELPQFLNVLRGDMSLVGPRPPISYEVEAYDLWHRRRLLEAKPGITGLWQVNGRNRVEFDEMVRLDLIYAKTWSPWMDMKILLRTPRAVVEGAY